MVLRGFISSLRHKPYRDWNATTCPHFPDLGISRIFIGFYNVITNAQAAAGVHNKPDGPMPHNSINAAKTGQNNPRFIHKRNWGPAAKRRAERLSERLDLVYESASLPESRLCYWEFESLQRFCHKVQYHRVVYMLINGSASWRASHPIRNGHSHLT